MIHTIRKLLLILLLTDLTVVSSGQYFEIRSVENSFGYMEIQLRDTTGSGAVNTSDTITDLQFEIRWLNTSGSDIDMEILCSAFNLVDGLYNKQSKNSWYWRAFAADSMPVAGNNWSQNTWQTVATVAVTKTSGDGIGGFAVPPGSWVVQGLNLGINGDDYPISIADSISSLTYPTVVYDHIWQGGSAGGGYSGTSWTYGPNWKSKCGEAYPVGQEPDSNSACIIPGGLSNYPSDFYNSVIDSCNILRILNGASVNVPGSITLVIKDKSLLESGGVLDVAPGGSVVVK